MKKFFVFLLMSMCFLTGCVCSPGYIYERDRVVVLPQRHLYTTTYQVNGYVWQSHNDPMGRPVYTTSGTGVAPVVDGRVYGDYRSTGINSAGYTQTVEGYYQGTGAGVIYGGTGGTTTAYPH